MTKKELINEWLKINVELNNNLEKLNSLDNEREKLIQRAKEQGQSLKTELQQEMQKSFEQYKYLSVAMKELRKKSDDIKALLMKILTDKDLQELLNKKHF